MTNDQHLMALAVTSGVGDDGGLDHPVHFSGQGCAGVFDSFLWFKLLNIAAAAPGFDTSPYRLTSRRIALSADQSKRLADAIEQGAAALKTPLDSLTTYLEPLRAGALTLYPPAPDSDSPLGALAMDFS